MPNELLPTNIQFGTVVGRFGSAPLIAGDADGLPDFSPATGLTVTFTPSTAAVIDATASPAPVTIEMVPIVCGLDSQGYLVGGDGQRGVKLIATDDTDINPSGWTYSVTFLRAGAKVAAFRDFSMSLPAGVTKDIALTIPVPSSSGVSLSQAQAAEAAAVSAASAASASAAAATTAASNALAATATKVDKGATEVNVKDYGAAGNNTGDDTAAFQAAHDALTNGGKMVIPAGRYRLTGTVAVTKTITIEGASRGILGTLGGGVYILATANNSPFTVAAEAVSFRRVTFMGYTVTRAATITANTTGVRFMSGDRHIVQECSFQGWNRAVWFQNCASWVVRDNYFDASTKAHIHIQNVALPDSGDQVVSGNSFFSSGSWACETQILQGSAGGTKYTNNKFYASAANRCIDVAIDDGVNTSIALISNNSFEHFQVSAIRVTQAGPAYTGTFFKTIIDGNQFTVRSSGAAIDINGLYTNNAGIRTTVITANQMDGRKSDSNAFINIANTRNVTVAANQFTTGTTGVNIASTAQDVNVDSSNHFQDVNTPIAGVAGGASASFGSGVLLDPTTKSNGAISAFDTGQTASPASFGVAPLTYIGGKIGHVPFAGPNSAGYLQVNAGGRVRRFGAMVSWPSGSLGSVAFVLPFTPWGTAGNIVGVKAGIHLVMYGNGIWHVSRWNPGSETNYADQASHGRYGDVRDGVARPIDVWIDLDTSTFRIYFPDGSSATVASPYIAADTGNTVVWELYENDGATDIPAAFGALWADSISINPVTSPITSKPSITSLIESGQRTVYEYTTPGSYFGSVPAGTKGILFTGIAPGGGGGSGARGADGGIRAGGSAGGSGGYVQDLFMPLSALGTTWQVVVGAAGTGGAAKATDDTAGSAGGSGGTVQFISGSALFRVIGGGGGGGGAIGAAGAAGGAGAPGATAGVAASAVGLVGTAGTANLTGGAGGAAAGGGITAANAASNGGTGATAGLWSVGTGGAGGTTAGGVAGSGAAPLNGRPGDGAGGGASSVTGAAQAGGAAVGFGSGGGGGGASKNGGNSGAGGNGGPGYARITIVRS